MSSYNKNYHFTKKSSKNDYAENYRKRTFMPSKLANKLIVAKKLMLKNNSDKFSDFSRLKGKLLT